MTLKDILHWDLYAGVASAVLAFFVCPTNVSSAVAKDFYSAGITVLAIVFAVFFAALAIIMSATDSKFVIFLEKTGDYTGLISTFKYTLALLFISLLVSLVLFAFSDLRSKPEQPKVLISIFTLLFVYSLFSTASAVIDSIRYTERRVEFLLSGDENED
jgi:hypothetical protein